jgi:hypothetical protein
MLKHRSTEKGEAMKRLTVDLDDQKHMQFKLKATAASLTMRQVLDMAIDDYLSGKWRPAPSPARSTKKVPTK